MLCREQNGSAVEEPEAESGMLNGGHSTIIMKPGTVVGFQLKSGAGFPEKTLP